MNDRRRRSRATSAAGAVRRDGLLYVTSLAVAIILSNLLFAVRAADGALVRPWEGAGDFGYALDIVERPRADDAIDLVLLFSVPNAALDFREEWGGGQRGKLAAKVRLVGDTGTSAREIELDLVARSRDDATAQTAYQVFTLMLPEITSGSGRLRCELRDLEAGRRLRLADDGADDPLSVAEGDWFADTARRDAHGLWLGSPLFLAGAPRQEIAASRDDGQRPERALLGEFLHPNRRYGVEQANLQVVFDIEALGLTPENADHLPRNLLVQLLSPELDYAMRDTVTLDLDPVSFVAGGGLAELSWEYDVNSLPPGTYQLSCAPLDGYGNAWIAEFDVFWSLQSFARPADESYLIGRMVLLGDRRDAFEKAGESGREAILARFWNENDPDPETPGNEAQQELWRRMAYVNRFLGGFGRSGPVDDRGLIYVMLGEPDEIQQQVIPLNARNFEDAVDRVYNAFLGVSYGDMMYDGYSSEEQTIQSVRQKLDRTTSFERFKSFELWIYQGNGRSLFPNVYTDMPLGLRFLFLAKLGGSKYSLEVSNAWERGMPGK